MKSLSSIQIETSENTDINLSPLIDMVFLLLIFFMVTTVFVDETGVDIEKPVAASAQDLEKNSILIAVTENGEIRYGGREVNPGGVRGLVARLLRERDMPVIVLADERAHTGTVVNVIDQCKLAGAGTVSIAAAAEMQ